MNCSAKTAKGKQCSFKAIHESKYCKKHSIKEQSQSKYTRKIEFNKIMYHNHQPNSYKSDCPCCKLIT